MICQIALMWLSMDLTDDKLALIHEMVCAKVDQNSCHHLALQGHSELIM